MKYVPEHNCVWHDLVSRLSPLQFFPPNAGAGLVQVRIRCCVPVPHVLEHGPQALHSVQLPSTAQNIVVITFSFMNSPITVTTGFVSIKRVISKSNVYFVCDYFLYKGFKDTEVRI